MNVKIYSNYQLHSTETANIIREIVNKKPNSLIYLAAGNTPTETLRVLVKMSRLGQVDFLTM